MPKPACIVLHRAVLSLNAAEESLFYVARLNKKEKLKKGKLNENRNTVQ